MDEQNPLTITITGTTVTLEGEAIIGFALNNLVNTLTATTDQSEEWNYTLTVHMIVQDVYNVINLNRSGQTLSVDLTADMLPYSGRYEMQFVATNGDYVSHTDIFEVFVKNTLDPVKQYTPVPSEFYQIQKDVQQNAQLAQSSANQAEQSATDAEGYATQAQQSAQDASEYLAQVQESANEASQSATQAAESATQAAQSAQTAQTAVDSIGDSVQQAQTAANNAQQSATQAGTSATQAQESATQAQGYATTAGNSATSAQQSATSAQQSAANAGQSATQAQTSATQASTSATQASESETNAAESATQAQQSASAAQQSVTSASESASEASTSAQQAASFATAAQNAQQAIENMTASATTLAPGSDASVTKTTDQGIVNLEFGIPQGEKGDAGLGVPVPTVDDANDVPVVNSTGTAYELQPYTNDNAVGANPWSSKQIVDSFCPPFTTSGSVVTCNPVKGYPLNVVSPIVPVQEGSGDPSPENVRPISGWNVANLSICGANIINISEDVIIPKASYSISISSGIFFDAVKSLPKGKTFFMSWDDVGASSSGTTNAFVFYKGGVSQNFRIKKNRSFVIPDGIEFDALLCYAGQNKTQDAVWSNFRCGPTLESVANYTPYNPASKTITLPFGQTVYGGELDWTTGVLTVTNAEIASYSGEPLPGVWISDRDVYSQGATPTTGAQVVYELADPITIQLTPQEILALSGTNTIYTDTGDTTVSGRQDLINYLQSLSGAVLGG